MYKCQGFFGFEVEEKKREEKRQEHLDKAFFLSSLLQCLFLQCSIFRL